MKHTKLGHDFGIAVSAGEALIRIDTDEISDAITGITDVCKQHEWNLRVFDAANGMEYLQGKGTLVNNNQAAASASKPNLLNAISGANEGPVTSLEMLTAFWKETAIPDVASRTEIVPSVLIIKNMHLMFEGPRRETVSALVQHIVADKVDSHKDYKKLKAELYEPNGIRPDSDTGKFLVGLMPSEAVLPPEVSPLFKLVTHGLPDEEELRSIYLLTKTTDAEDDDDIGEEEEQNIRLCVSAALGLTRQQAEGVYAASLVTNKRIVPSYVWTEKSKILNKEGLVELYTGKETFKDVAGLEGAKKFLKRILTPSEFDIADPDVRAKGAVFVGPPGVGKTLIAKATGNELGLPILTANPGNWMGQYVGQSEAKTRKAFQIIKAHAPCVVIIDEVEKVMPRSSSADSGVGGRMEGSFLTAMNDMKERVFWAFTANNVAKMHEAFLRAERVDGVFYVKLPDSKQRAKLWLLYGTKFFPKEIELHGKSVKYPGHMPTDFDTVLGELKLAPKKDFNVKGWADRFTLPLMCLTEKQRASALNTLKSTNQEVHAAIRLIADSGWSPAEIRSCCRLARLQSLPLADTQKQIRPVSVSAKGVIEKLEEWASESALDAETGEIYKRPECNYDDDDEDDERPSSVKARRKVRSMKPE